MNFRVLVLALAALLLVVSINVSTTFTAKPRQDSILLTQTDCKYPPCD